MSMHTFLIRLFIDFPIDNKIDVDKRMFGIYQCQSESLNKAFHELLDDTLKEFNKNFYIGISFVCNEERIYDFNYKNKVIYDDELLREWFYC